MAPAEQLSRRRGETTILIAAMLLGFAGLNHVMTSATVHAEHRERALKAHVAERRCVVAHEETVVSATPYARTTSQVPSLYRCDLPTAGEYVDRAVLQADALAHHP